MMLFILNLFERQSDRASVQCFTLQRPPRAGPELVSPGDPRTQSSPSLHVGFRDSITPVITYNFPGSELARNGKWEPELGTKLKSSNLLAAGVLAGILTIRQNAHHRGGTYIHKIAQLHFSQKHKWIMILPVEYSSL